MGGSYRATEESTATGVQRAKRRDFLTEDWCRPVLTNIRGLSVQLPGQVGAGSWGSGFGGQIPGRGLGLAVWKQPEGASAPQLPGRESGKCLDQLKRQETIVSGCTKRGDSFPVCPQNTEHCLSKLQRWAQAMAISLDPRDRHEMLTLLLLPPKILCASTGPYPHTPRSLCSPPLPGTRDPGTTSLGECTVHLKLLQHHSSLCHCRLALHSVPLPCPSLSEPEPPNQLLL